MASIQERRDSTGKLHYRVQVRLKGYPVQSASFTRRTDAKHWAVQTEAAIRERRHFKTVEAKRHTFGEMIDRYIRDVLPDKKQLSRHSQEPRLLWWKERIGSYALCDVTPAMIAEQRDLFSKGITRAGKPRSPTTVIHHLATLSHCFTIAMKEWEWIDHNPVARVSKPKWPRGRVRYLSDEERARLLTACEQSKNSALYDIIVLALTTGMRYSEIMNLTWADVDFRRGMILLQETKNGERRGVPLVGHAFDQLQRRARIRRIDTGLVFASPHQFGQGVKPYDIKSAWHTALKQADIDDFRFHDLRHTTASYLAMNGASLAEIAEVLGHKTLAMVKRYAHLSHTHVSGVVASMAARIFITSEEESSASNDSLRPRVNDY